MHPEVDLGQCVILGEHDWSPSPFQTQDSYQKMPKLFAESPASPHFPVNLFAPKQMERAGWTLLVSDTVLLPHGIVWIWS